MPDNIVLAVPYNRNGAQTPVKRCKSSNIWEWPAITQPQASRWLSLRAICLNLQITITQLEIRSTESEMTRSCRAG
jgi:hypothetical protein